MRVGQDIRYVDPDGVNHAATLTEIVGEGDSFGKIVNLTYLKDGEAVTVEGVRYEPDAAAGEGFWLEVGQRRSREPEDEQVLPVEPLVEFESFPDTTDAAPPTESSTRRRKAAQ